MTAPDRAAVEAAVERADRLIARIRETSSVRMSHLEMLRIELGMVATEHGKAMAELERLGRVEQELLAIVCEHKAVTCQNVRHDGGNGLHCSVCEYDDIDRGCWPCPTVRHAMAALGVDADRIAELAARDEREAGRG